ncbi:MAG: hypothetical protein A2086_06990 [Spirochaetes bacterium GWD1_27_9]|nr:MAG: hypothetical protein A2Z98_05815 [Spirochaetes bacterium GWB1_27_13]OHD35660.1 MAG: hypothetical protein A2086_06990 [Spirochaetes bacterium GWD1_27_9]
MNAGLAKAFSYDVDRVVMLCNDVEVDEDFYKNLAIIEDTIQPTILCPSVYFLQDKNKASYTYGNLDLEKWSLTHIFDESIDKIVFPDYYPASALVWDRKSFLLTEGFNKDYYCYWEDVELSFRCKNLSVNLQSCQSLKIHHFGRGTTGKKKIYSTHFEEGKEKTKKIVGC